MDHRVCSLSPVKGLTAARCDTLLDTQESATVEALRRQSAAVYGAREYELQREVAELHGSVALGEVPTTKAKGGTPFKAAEMSASLNALMGKTDAAPIGSSLDALLKRTAVAARTLPHPSAARDLEWLGVPIS